MVRGFWWDGHPNFGDALTPWLLPRYRLVPALRPADRADIVGVGSILEMVPTDFRGMIWGSGLMYDAPRSFPSAHVLAVRGALTRERIGAPDETVLGDPGLLVARHIGEQPTTTGLAVLPHGAHLEHPAFRALARRCPDDTIWVDPRRPPWQVARLVASAECVVTSSLHGLIFADSFGIPAVRVSVDEPLKGGDFKFRDYESVVRPSGDRWRALDGGTDVGGLLDAAAGVDRTRVDRAIADLEEVLRKAWHASGR